MWLFIGYAFISLLTVKTIFKPILKEMFDGFDIDAMDLVFATTISIFVSCVWPLFWSFVFIYGFILAPLVKQINGERNK